MLYWLYRHASINLFQYITLRAAIAFFVAFILCVWIMPKFIKWAKEKDASQPIYELAPSTHKVKNEIPTMGGVIFVLATLVATLLCVKLNNYFVVGGISTLLLFGLIGFKDDFAKIVGKSNGAGLKPKAKLYMQCIAALVISVLIYLAPTMSTELFIPFYKHPLYNISIFAIFFWMLVLISSSNAVNLTDGLDGLATIPVIFSLLTLGIFVYVGGNAVISAYLLLPKISGSGEVLIIIAALMGSLVGFLWFNCYPAQVFMGDSGSLSAGAFIGYSAIISKNEFLLLLIGFVFVMETVSVILQIGSFKTRKKRVFLMAPIHHHFEIKGWAENKIIVRFWIIALLSNLLALTALKIR
jgi:phospho-N-acetylmuramoyl-pentapeptide-transferase